MPHKTWVVGEEVLAADFNNYVQDQVVSTFATAAARDSAIVSPDAGMVAWLDDHKSLCVYNGTGWVMVPKGRIAYGVAAARDCGPGTTALLSVAFTLPTARLCRLECHGGYSVITNNANNEISISLGFDGATPVRTATSHDAQVGSGWWGSGMIYQSLASGAHTADLKVINASSSATARVAASTTWAGAVDMGT